MAGDLAAVDGPVLVVGDGAVRYLELLAPPRSRPRGPASCPPVARRPWPDWRPGAWPPVWSASAASTWCPTTDATPTPASTGRSAPRSATQPPRAAVTVPRATGADRGPDRPAVVVVPLRRPDLRRRTRHRGRRVRTSRGRSGCSRTSWPNGRPGPTGERGSAIAWSGYAGQMSVDDEAHVNNIGVDPAWQGQAPRHRPHVRPGPDGPGPGPGHLTLEVLVGNEPAIALYRRFGMAPVGSGQLLPERGGRPDHVGAGHRHRGVRRAAGRDRGLAARRTSRRPPRRRPSDGPGPPLGRSARGASSPAET